MDWKYTDSMLLADTPKQPILSDIRTSERGHEILIHQNNPFSRMSAPLKVTCSLTVKT